MKITNHLKHHRQKKGLTQAKLAQMVKVSETHYQRLEYGETVPSVLIARLLAQAFQTTVEALFPLSNEVTSQSVY